MSFDDGRNGRRRVRILGSLGISAILAIGLGTSDVHGMPCDAPSPPDAAPPSKPPFSVSVRDAPYGAKGDSVTDDTSAIQHALDDAGAALAASSASSATVFVPSGSYLVRTHLTVPAGVVLAGVFRSVSEGNSLSGSVLYAVADANNAHGAPFITLAAGATLRGVTVFHPEQVDQAAPIMYPWAIRVAGENVSVIDVMLTNPWQGIDLSTNATAGHLIQRVFGQPIHLGLVVDHCTGGGRLDDVHFWPFWKVLGTSATRISSMATGTAYEFRLATGEVVDRVFELGYQTGMRFTNSPAASCTTGLPCGASSGHMSSIAFDTTGVSLDVLSTDTAGWTIDGLIAVGILAPNPIPVWHRGPLHAKMNITNASFFGGHTASDGSWVGLYQVVRWDGIGELSLASSTMTRQNPFQPAIDIRAGSAVLDGNYFGENVGVAISASGGAVVKATANQMIGNTVKGPVTLAANAM
ncbi:MAG: hypothetical protein JWP97_6536 [Labilithrix sp.]|nr:hypothetical protein [Labilithrix sp.]